MDHRSGVSYNREEAKRYFLERITPKLQELQHFRARDLSKDGQAEKAILEVLAWAGPDVENFGEDFQEFYDGLLLYRNLTLASTNRRPVQEFVVVFFEIHGSDPRRFPAAVKSGLGLFSMCYNAHPRGTNPPYGLWDTLNVAESLGLPEARMLRLYLKSYQETFGSSALGNAVHNLEDLNESGHLHLPFSDGFNHCARQAVTSFTEDLSRFWVTFESPRERNQTKERSTATMKRGNKERLAENPGGIENMQILVGPSGCGKTSSIHSLLKKNWGFYLLPGNMPEASMDSTRVNEDELRDRLEYRPRRGGGSRDTQTWLDDVKSMYEHFPFPQYGAHLRACTLLSARIWVLCQFRLKGGPHCTPSDWLKLQTSCTNPRKDIFNHLYRVARFFDLRIPEYDGFRDSQVLYCFDEAQCDLPAVSPGRSVWPHVQSIYRNDFPPLTLMTLTAFGLVNDHAWVKELGISLSGTALQLGQMHKMIQGVREEVEARAIKLGDLQPKVNDAFQLIETDKDFRGLLRQRGHAYDEWTNIIVQHSIPLRGRVLWSVCYLDEIERLIGRYGREMRKADIRKACAKICRSAKEGLKERLRDMELRPFIRATKEKQSLLRSPLNEYTVNPHGGDSQTALENFQSEQKRHEELMDELCWLAIRSDLFGEASIFASSESAQLVALGFAFVENQESTELKVKLKERLAVDAAIEYFQTRKLSNGQSMYDRALVNFLYLEQNNTSALGKTAELFFAWHLRKVLRQPQAHKDMALQTFTDTYRAEVLRLLVGASHSVKYLQSGGTVPDVQHQFGSHAGCNDMTEYCLVEGKRTAYQEGTEADRDPAMWNWLEKIRNGLEGDRLDATFWFPSNNTGPDVIFALKKKDSQTHPSHSRNPSNRKRKRNSGSAPRLDYSLVLCAVQIKRKEVVQEHDKAIETTDPNYWFSKNKIEDGLGITRELREWQEDGYPFVRILVSALTDPKEFKEPKNKAPTAAEKYFSDKAAKGQQRSSKTGQKRPKDRLAEQGREENLQDVEIPSDQQYYTSVGASDDDLLFGDAFRMLRQAQGVETLEQSGSGLAKSLPIRT